MFTKLLVPLDGSSFAEKALAPALALAQKGQGEVILLSVPYTKQIVVEEWENYGYDQTLEFSQRKLRAYLDDLLTRIPTTDVTLPTLVKIGDEAGVIVDTAVTKAVDLIVMATHGRSGISRWMLGSVTERVLRTAPCPILVIREDKPVSHIMITLDGSALSECALGPGMEVASRLGSRVTLLSVATAATIAPKLAAETEKRKAGLQTSAIQDDFHWTETYLQRLARELQADLEQIVHIAPKTGPIAEAILETVATDQVDLLVMATHGRSGLKRWVYGSVTEKVMRAAHCNLLIIRPPQSELKPQAISSEQFETEQPKKAPIKSQDMAQPVEDEPQSVMEKALLTHYLHQKGYRLGDLNNLPEEQAKALMVAASQYASLRLAQVESTAHFRQKLQRPS